MTLFAKIGLSVASKREHVAWNGQIFFQPNICFGKRKLLLEGINSLLKDLNQENYLFSKNYLTTYLL